MANLRASIKRKFEILFEELHGAGFVLDFSNNSFDNFVKDVTGKDIYEEKYSDKGNSKENRLRTFIEKEPDFVVANLLSELLEEYKTITEGNGRKDLLSDCYKEIERLKSNSIKEADQKIYCVLKKLKKEKDIGSSNEITLMPGIPKKVTPEEEIKILRKLEKEYEIIEIIDTYSEYV